MSLSGRHKRLILQNHTSCKMDRQTAVGSPVSVVVADLVMEDVESQALSSFSFTPLLKTISRQHFLRTLNRPHTLFISTELTT